MFIQSISQTIYTEIWMDKRLTCEYDVFVLLYQTYLKEKMLPTYAHMTGSFSMTIQDQGIWKSKNSLWFTQLAYGVCVCVFWEKYWETK